MVTQSNQIIKKKLFGGGLGTTPFSILGSDLEFGFDFSNLSLITFNGSNISEILDESGKYKAVQATPASQPPWANNICSPDGIADGMEILTVAGGAPVNIFDDLVGSTFAISLRVSNEHAVAYYVSDKSQNDRYAGLIAGANDVGNNEVLWGQKNDANQWTARSTNAVPLEWCSTMIIQPASGVKRMWINGIEEVVTDSQLKKWVGNCSGADALNLFEIDWSVAHNFYTGNWKYIGYSSKSFTEDQIAKINSWMATKV